jgi:hypothetical protein
MEKGFGEQSLGGDVLKAAPQGSRSVREKGNEIMIESRKRFVVPILVIILGVTWLLNVLNIIPGVDWIWTIGLAAVGILTLAVGGINKLTVVIGPFFMVASVCSILRQTGRLQIDREIPILTIVLGCLLLLVQFINLPLPEILKPEQNEN